MDFTFKTVSEFNDYFKDEKTCYEFLESQRWNGVPVCPHCANAKKPYKVKARGKFTDIPSYRCSDKDCDLPFTVRTASIFEGSKVELRKWLQAAYELSTAKKSISSVELATRIDVSQKTAWFINHRLRAMLFEIKPALLIGIIQVDETYVGGKAKNKHKSTYAEGKRINDRRKSGKTTQPSGDRDNKTMVVGLNETNGKVIAKVVPQATKGQIFPLIDKHTAKDAVMVTDDLYIYRNVTRDLARKHVSVNHSAGEYAKDGFHNNGIENFWSLLKRGIIGTFHQVSPQHLQRYVDEFSYRYNNREAGNAFRFNDSIKKAHNARLTYRELTGKPQ